MLPYGGHFKLVSVVRVNLDGDFSLGPREPLQSINYVVNGHSSVVNVLPPIPQGDMRWFGHDEI
jgi:hypothetical protein